MASRHFCTRVEPAGVHSCSAANRERQPLLYNMHMTHCHLHVHYFGAGHTFATGGAERVPGQMPGHHSSCHCSCAGFKGRSSTSHAKPANPTCHGQTLLEVTKGLSIPPMKLQSLQACILTHQESWSAWSSPCQRVACSLQQRAHCILFAPLRCNLEAPAVLLWHFNGRRHCVLPDARKSLHLASKQQTCATAAPSAGASNTQVHLAHIRPGHTAWQGALQLQGPAAEPVPEPLPTAAGPYASAGLLRGSCCAGTAPADQQGA